MTCGPRAGNLIHAVTIQVTCRQETPEAVLDPPFVAEPIPGSFQDVGLPCARSELVEPLDDGFTVAIIPHTAEVTNLGAKQPGDLVNLEVDVMAKYVERLVSAYLPEGSGAPR